MHCVTIDCLVQRTLRISRAYLLWGDLIQDSEANGEYRFMLSWIYVYSLCNASPSLVSGLAGYKTLLTRSIGRSIASGIAPSSTNFQ